MREFTELFIIDGSQPWTCRFVRFEHGRTPVTMTLDSDLARQIIEASHLASDQWVLRNGILVGDMPLRESLPNSTQLAGILFSWKLSESGPLFSY